MKLSYIARMLRANIPNAIITVIGYTDNKVIWRGYADELSQVPYYNKKRVVEIRVDKTTSEKSIADCDKDRLVFVI